MLPTAKPRVSSAYSTASSSPPSDLNFSNSNSFSVPKPNFSAQRQHLNDTYSRRRRKSFAFWGGSLSTYFRRILRFPQMDFEFAFPWNGHMHSMCIATHFFRRFLLLMLCNSSLFQFWLQMVFHGYHCCWGIHYIWLQEFIICM
ncbi:hypothetical protein HK096_003616 [Nowakowskiella sp. JEL0078]|nr:hypothetical protein HK096_003616 [Nowakowskiella sp. JEL0078]